MKAQKSKKKKKPTKPSVEPYVSSTGIPISVGKNNKQNDYVTFKVASKSDTWLHTKDIPGSHVIIHDSEPDEETILAYLLRRNIGTQIFRGLLENAASEQGARMSAMDAATRNAGDMINRLTIDYNRQRQANITKELIEIISGAEAL